MDGPPAGGKITWKSTSCQALVGQEARFVFEGVYKGFLKVLSGFK